MPPKKPKQERSKNLVNEIVKAGTLIFERMGFESVNTNKIAEFAGVSIGSFYRYFSDKGAFFSKVIDSRLEENRQKLKDLLEELPASDFEEFVEDLTHQFIDHLLEQKGYLRALIAFQFELSKNQLIIHSRWKMAEILAAEFSKRFDWLREDSDLQKRFFYLINAGFGLVYLYSQVDTLPMSVEEMKSEMVANIIFYLKKNE